MSSSADEPARPGVYDFTPDELETLRTGPPPLPGPRRVLPLEDEPTMTVARYLFPTERYRGEWRRHYVHPAKTLAFVAAFWAVAVWIVPEWLPVEPSAPYIAAVSAGAVLLGAYCVLEWRYNLFVLTNKRLLLVQGPVARRVDTIPLARVTDVRYTQSALGRLLNFGTFRFDAMSWRNRLRKVADLPNPNELYLRLIEETYEPEAVEARLVGAPDEEEQPYEPLREGALRKFGIYQGLIEEGEDDVLAQVPRAASAALHEAIHGPELANYDGWVSVEILDRGLPVEPTEDRRVALDRGGAYELVVTIAPRRLAGLAEPLVVTDGEDRSTVDFTAELDSDRPALRHAPVEVAVEPDGDGRVVFPLRPDGPADPPPWLWIRVAQQRRIIQSIELTIDYRETARA